jgi:hypothetical protein
MSGNVYLSTTKRWTRDAFNRPTLVVARDLLGKFIVRADRRVRLSAMITEVEAYKGPRDAASHAYKGRRTQRVEPLVPGWRHCLLSTLFMACIGCSISARPAPASRKECSCGLCWESALVCASHHGARTGHTVSADRQKTRRYRTRRPSKHIWVEDRGDRSARAPRKPWTSRRRRLCRAVLGGPSWRYWLTMRSDLTRVAAKSRESENPHPLDLAPAYIAVAGTANKACIAAVSQSATTVANALIRRDIMLRIVHIILLTWSLWFLRGCMPGSGPRAVRPAGP